MVLRTVAGRVDPRDFAEMTPLVWCPHSVDFILHRIGCCTCASRLNCRLQVTNYLLDQSRLLDEEQTFRYSLEIKPRSARLSSVSGQSSWTTTTSAPLCLISHSCQSPQHVSRSPASSHTLPVLRQHLLISNLRSLL